MAAGAPVAALGRFRHAERALRRVVEQADAWRNARADDGPRADDAVVVIDFDPIVVRQPDEVGVLVVHPDRIAAARQRLHAQRVAVGGVDVPFAVRREVIQHDAVRAFVGFFQVARLAELAARLEGRQVFAERDVGFMVEIQMLPARERAPRDQLLDVLAIGRVGARAVGDARPIRRRQRAAGAGTQVFERVAHRPRAGGEMRVINAGLDGLGLEGAEGHLAVRFGGEMKDDIAGVLVVAQRRVFLAAPFLRGVRLEVGIVGVGDFVVRAVNGQAVVAEVRPDGDEALEHVRVVARDDLEVWCGFAGNQFTLALGPVLDGRLRDFGGRVVHQRRDEDVLHRAGEILRCKLGCFLGDAPEDRPVALRLPAGRYRRLQGVDEAVHVRRVEIVLLVEGRGGQDDVRVERRRVHAEVQIHNEVHLAQLDFVVPDHVLDIRLGDFLGDGVVVRAKIVLEEILVALGRRHEGVAAPDVEHARETLGVVRVFHRELELALFQFSDRVRDDFVVRLRAGGLRLLDDLEVAFRELRVARQPAEADGEGLFVRRVAVGHRMLRVADRADFAELLVVTPLVRVHVVERRRVLLARRPGPVAAERDGCPRRLRGKFFLADVMVQPAALLANAAAEHERVDDAAVDEIVVIPVVDARADDGAAFAAGVLGGARPFAGEIHRHAPGHAGEPLLPRGRERLGIVLVTLRPLALEAAINAVLREVKFHRRGDEHRAVDGFNLLHGNVARDDARVRAV